jgi:hypothetical protein
MKITVFWDVTLRRLVEIYRYFGGTYCLRFQDLRVNLTSNNEARGK